MQAPDTPLPFDTRHDGEVLDALRVLEASLRAALGPEVLFVVVFTYPGPEGNELHRASNCDRAAPELLRHAITLPDRGSGHYFSTAQQ